MILEDSHIKKAKAIIFFSKCKSILINKEKKIAIRFKEKELTSSVR